MFRNIFITLLIFCCGLNSQDLIPPQHSFFQINNINTIFYNNGICNYDKFTFPGGSDGFIWPVASILRNTLSEAEGIWIAAKVGPQRELRASGSLWGTYYTGGNIPVVGGVPPITVCNDSTWKVYLVNLNDVSLVNGGTRIKTAGGRNYTFIYTPWANWPISKGAAYVEVNNIPGYQPGWNSDRPGIGNSQARPDEICFTVFMDYTNCTNNIHNAELSLPGGTLPLGVEIHETIFAFNCIPLKDVIFIKWKIINKSQFNWDSTYISVFEESDIGFGYDDASGCDTNRNLGFTYNADNNDEGYYGLNPPAIGCSMIQTPLKHTGNPLDTARLPYDTLIGYKMTGMTGWYLIFNTSDPCISDPDNAEEAYNIMKGLRGCGIPIINPITGLQTKYMYPGDACHRTGWYDSFSVQTRLMINHGPIVMNILDTQIITEAVVIGFGGNNFQNVCALQNLSDSALKYYYNDFRSCIPIGINPISSEIPDKFILHQNYPNPFNPTTKIKFSLPHPSEGGAWNVRLDVYDVLGRHVASLIPPLWGGQEGLSPGTYEVDWDGTNFASGVYYYSLITGNYTETKKMVLMK